MTTEIQPYDANDIDDANDIAQFCRDHEGNHLKVGDVVESIETTSLGQRGEVRELRPDGTCLVAWDQGVTMSVDCDALAWVDL